MVSMGVNRRVREAIVAGIFYPEDAGELSSALDMYFTASRMAESLDGFEATTSKRAVAIMSPHAALAYSGRVQASAWTAIREPVKRVVMIASMGNPDSPAAYLPEAEVFQTPLGDVEVDTAACAELESCSTLFSVNDLPHLESHAIEVQLPFMRTLFPEAVLVPILVGGGASASTSLARAIDLVFEGGEDNLIVVSSNLASSMVAYDAKIRSNELVEAIAGGNRHAISGMRDLSGSTAIVAAMSVRSVQEAKFRLLFRVDSTGHASSERVVHYGAAAWYPVEAL